MITILHQISRYVYGVDSLFHSGFCLKRSKISVYSVYYPFKAVVHTADSTTVTTTVVIGVATTVATGAIAVDNSDTSDTTGARY